MAGVMVLAEHLNGVLADLSFELAGKGRAMADALAEPLDVAVLGAPTLASEFGVADRVIAVTNTTLEVYSPTAYRAALAQLIREYQPRLVLVGNTSIGMDLAAAVSAELSLPLVSYCTGLRIDDGQIVATAQLYGGKVLVDALPATDHCIVAVLAGSFPADAGRRPGQPSIERRELAGVTSGGIRFRRLIQPEAGDVDITRQDILVSVGRGIQSQENLEGVEELARALGGELCASRPIVDNGWLPKSRQVGKSGLTVRPRLYLAVGVSGAPEHLEGMRGAECIIAVNSDPSAPIFEVADYGVVADLFEIVPALTDRLKQ